MKILIFSWRDIKNPHSGGAEIFTHETAKRWAKKHSVVLVTSQFPGGETTEKIDGVTIFRPAELTYSPVDYVQYLKQTQNFYQNYLKGKADLIIDQFHGLPLFCKFYAQEKIVALAHEVAKDIWFHEFSFPYNLAGFISEKLVLKLYSTIPFIAVSESTAKDLKKAGIKKIFVVPEGISFKPLNSLPRKADYPLFVSIGRITQMKRIEETIKAFKIVTDTYPEAKLLIVGRNGTDYTQSLKKLTWQLEIEEKVDFTGFISNEEKIRLLKKAWALLSTSVREGWSIVVIEAAACGTPAVTYRVPGLVDSVKHQKTGLIANKNTPEELAKNIKLIITNHPLYQELSRNALAYSHNFSWDKTARKCLEIIENTCHT